MAASYATGNVNTNLDDCIGIQKAGGNPMHSYVDLAAWPG